MTGNVPGDGSFEVVIDHGVVVSLPGVPFAFAIKPLRTFHSRDASQVYPDRSARIVFVARETARLDVCPAPTDLGEALVTTIEQTVLDLARRPSLRVADDQLAEAVHALLPRCDEDGLMDLARDQRLRSALVRVRRLAHR